MAGRRDHPGRRSEVIFGPYPAVVTHIHDGDTCSLDLDLGFGLHATEFNARFYGINAPELATAAGKTALAFLDTILHVGDAVLVTSYGWDKYGGRFDALLVKPGTNASINKQMLDAGQAVVLGGVVLPC